MQKLAAKLVQVMKEVAYVEKKGTNDYHHYSYATSADVLLKINAALTKYGICSLTLPEVISIADVTTTKGNVEHLATVKMDIILMDAESGETATITGLGSGQDGGDKAVMKAQTAAIKYAYLLSMAISTGDDPEADSKTDENKAVYSSQAHREAKPNENVCSGCGSKLTDGVKTVSLKKYGRPLCMKCQRKAREIA
jgi:hypothetical protein